MQIVDAADSERVSIDEQLQTKDGAASKILAVTSCPTGIAHTYMAAEGLEKAAAKAGCRIKIETRGSGGQKCSDGSGNYRCGLYYRSGGCEGRWNASMESM